MNRYTIKVSAVLEVDADTLQDALSMAREEVGFVPTGTSRGVDWQYEITGFSQVRPVPTSELVV